MPVTVDGVGAPPSSSTITSPTIVGAVPAPAAGRGFLVELGKATGVQLNSVAATTIFTTPAVGGFTRCRVAHVDVGNISAIATTASFSFGQGGTPTDWAASATYAGLSAAGKFITIVPPTASGSAEITATGINFVVNVTIPQGVATTADFIAWGYYE